jgi:hypothetical protein
LARKVSEAGAMEEARAGIDDVTVISYFGINFED